MRIVQISDSHISVKNPARTADLANCIMAINDISPAVDLVVHTGDIVHDGLREEYATVRQLLDTLLVPYRVLAGNRDNRSLLMEAFSDLIEVGKGAEYVQYSVDDFPVQLLMLDTVSSTSKGAMCAGRLAHVQKILSANSTKPVIVFMHHNPFEATEIPDPFQFEDWADVEQLQKIFVQSNQIQAVYCGHIHRNVDAVMGDNLPVSAISCIACDLRKGQLSEYDRTRAMFKVIEPVL